MAIQLSANYLEDLLDTRETVRRASLILRKGQNITEEAWDDEKKEWFMRKIGRQRPIEFDTLVGTGLSGTLLLPMIADRLKVNYLAIRKANDGSHSDGKHQGRLGKKWLFFDDFCASGDTLRRVYGAVERICNSYDHKTEFVGGYLYAVKNSANLVPASELVGTYGVPTPEYKKAQAKRRKEAEEADRKAREQEELRLQSTDSNPMKWPKGLNGYSTPDSWGVVNCTCEKCVNAAKPQFANLD